jgi:hypothetical protein
MENFQNHTFHMFLSMEGFLTNSLSLLNGLTLISKQQPEHKQDKARECVPPQSQGNVSKLFSIISGCLFPLIDVSL